MVDSRVKHLLQEGDALFAKKRPYDSLCQEIADNFYPERAFFTSTRSLGQEFADHLTTGQPVLARRELGNAFTSMLRPRGKKWAHVVTDRPEREDHWAKLWLQDKRDVMFRAMYDRRSQFVRTTSGADHDFAAFGQPIMSIDLNESADGMIYQLYHLKDVAWRDDMYGMTAAVHRNWSAPAHELVRKFRDKVHAKVKACAEKEPFKEINVRHIIVPADEYDTGKKWKHPWVSIWVDVENQHVMEEVNRPDPFYLIPGWQKVSGSQYAYSPATIVAMPDARLIQQITLTLLEAGEMAVEPPLMAREEAVRGDMQIYRGGITWVDLDKDQRLEDAIAPMRRDNSGLPFGMEMADRQWKIIKEMFFLDKLNLPDTGNRTAYEISQLVQEYIRNALPLFEPMEVEYNGQLCERTFDIMLRAGAFGPVDDIPDSIRGANIEFRFESPLHDAIEMQKAQAFGEAQQVIASGAALDPSVRHIIKPRIAVRDVLGARVPQEWLASEEEVEALAQQDAQMQAMQETMAAVGGAAGVAEQVGKAEQAMAGAE